MGKKSIVFVFILLAIGFAAISSTLVYNGTFLIAENTSDYDIIFTKAKIGSQKQTITSTNKTNDTIEFNVLLDTIGEEKILNYTVKNNSTQYGAKARMKCYALNDTESILANYVTVSGELDDEEITFSSKLSNAVLSNEIEFFAQESKNGTIVMSLKKSYAGDDELNLSLKCEIIANATESGEYVAPVKELWEPTYFEYGMPTYTSTTNYNDISQMIFAAMDDDNEFGVCTKNFGTLECFKAGNMYYEQNKIHGKNIFAGCLEQANSYKCETYVYYCEIAADWVECGYNGMSCKAYENGQVSCGQ